MTKREKIKILKSMRLYLQLNTLDSCCFCYAYIDAGDRFMLCADAEKLVISLGLEKPEVTAGDYWYPKTKEGTQTRIRKIDELIKRLSK